MYLNISWANSWSSLLSCLKSDILDDFSSKHIFNAEAPIDKEFNKHVVIWVWTCRTRYDSYRCGSSHIPESGSLVLTSTHKHTPAPGVQWIHHTCNKQSIQWIHHTSNKLSIHFYVLEKLSILFYFWHKDWTITITFRKWISKCT